MTGPRTPDGSPPEGAAPSGPQSTATAATEAAGVGTLAHLDAEFARIMAAFDKVMHHEGAAPVAGEMDPELEQKLGQAMARFLASERPAGVIGPDGEGIDEALRAHIKPLFEALFTTAHDHLKPHADALKAGREPPPSARTPIRVDLSSLFDPDPDDDDDDGKGPR